MYYYKIKNLNLIQPYSLPVRVFLCKINKIHLKKLEESEINPELQEKDESIAENSSEQNIIDAEAKNVEPNFKNDSLFKRVLENGFDGITTNPNYKLLALLIILLINLSLFFLVGNLGKTFLKNSGILG